MSMDSVVARVQELQQLIGGRPHPAPAALAATDPGNKNPTFAATLAQAAAPAQSVPFPSAPATGPAATTGPAGVGAPAAGRVSGIPFAGDINAAAARHRLDPALLAGLIRQESNFNPNAVSPAGARGLTQLMPATARGLGVTNAHDPVQAIEGGARYLRQQLDRFGNDPTRALAAYNAGPGAVLRHGGVPPYAETQAYVRKVQAYADSYRQTAAPVAAAAVPAPAVRPGVPALVAPPAAARPVPSGNSTSSGLGYSTL